MAFTGWAYRAVASLLATASLVGSEHPTLAVCPLSGAGAVPAAALRAVEDALGEGLGNHDIDLVERGRIAAALAEQALGQSGALDDASAARVGHLVGADVLVVGAARAVGEGAAARVQIDLRAVRVADGRILWSGDGAGDAPAVAAQAAALADDCAAGIARADDRVVAGERRPLGALKHHERAAALVAAGQHADAATEELLALREDPTLAAAGDGFLRVLADGGFPDLAAAEARVAVAAGAAADSVAARIAKAATGAAPAAPAAAKLESVAGDAASTIAWLEKAAARDDQVAPLARRDLASVWFAVAEQHAKAGRDRAAGLANREAVRRWTAACAEDPTLLALPWRRDGEPLEPALALVDYAYHPQRELADGSVYASRELLAELTDAVAAGVRLEGIPPPPPVELVELTVTDRARVHDDELVRIDVAPLRGAALVDVAALVGQRRVDGPGSAMAASMRQAWVGAEADPAFARAGRRWLVPFTGQGIPTGMSASLRDIVREQIAAGPAALGMSVHVSGERGPVRLVAVVARPRGSATKDAGSALGTGIVALLSGDLKTARAAFASLEGRLSGGGVTVPELVALAEDRK